MSSSMRTPSVVGILLVAAVAVPLRAQITERVSVRDDGGGINGSCDRPSISGSGRFVVFESWSQRLVSEDNNHAPDVFVHDRETNTTMLAGLQDDGRQFANGTFAGYISADGRYVSFVALSEQAAPAGRHATSQVFLRDLRDQRTEWISVSPSGVPANNDCGSASLSADGRFVSFASWADNLAPGEDRAGSDVFVLDRRTRMIRRVSVNTRGVPANGSSYEPMISRDAGFVAFSSDATNLSKYDREFGRDIYVHELSSGKTTLVSITHDGHGGDNCYYPSISGDGRFVVFVDRSNEILEEDQNGYYDVYLRDLVDGTTRRVSESPDGEPPNGSSGWASISADGRFVSFESGATNLAGAPFRNDWIYRRDYLRGTIQRLGTAHDGGEPNGSCSQPATSDDGASTAFTSWASNLVPGDSFQNVDVFVRQECAAVASSSNYGDGFPGSSGVPGLVANQDPILATTITLELQSSATSWTLGLLLTGLLEAAKDSGHGGVILVEPLIVAPLAIPPSGLTFSYSIPDDAALCGIEINLQAIEVDPGAQFGFSFTPGLKLSPGH